MHGHTNIKILIQRRIFVVFEEVKNWRTV